jgi:tetratricopeptide (TPR) repeat protein
MLGDILHKKDMKEEAYNAYDSCLVYDPDRMMCLNNYAYFLSVDGRELEKAEKMSHKTIMAEPTNGTYLDTYAWILYQEGRYEEAKMYIDMALKAMEQEIADLKKEAEAAGESLNPEYLEIDDEIKQHLEAIEKKLNENKDTK